MQPTRSRQKYPRVAICVDKSSRFGRGALQGIADYLETYGPWSLCLDHHASGSYTTDWLRHWNGDGILGFVSARVLAGQLRRSRISAVEVSGSRLDLQIPQVINDEPLIGSIAAEHLQERRFRHFAFFGYSNTAWSDRRLLGFRDSNAKRGFSTETFLCAHDITSLNGWEQTEQEVTHWLEKLPKPIGLMASSDRLALRILDACHRARLAVPEEIAVIGVDNDEETCRLATPPLSSVMDDPRRIGREAARLLGQLMASNRDSQDMPPVLVPPLGIATRRSTDTTAIDDPLIARSMRLIREHACEGLTVKELLPEVRMSHTTFYERFHTSLGIAPHQAILRVRLERVKNLLKQTDLSLEQIAERTGFSHPEYMQVAFKREVGATPGRYRRTAANWK
jgi:LacI family transcriptional regulator